MTWLSIPLFCCDLVPKLHLKRSWEHFFDCLSVIHIYFNKNCFVDLERHQLQLSCVTLEVLLLRKRNELSFVGFAAQLKLQVKRCCRAICPEKVWSFAHDNFTKIECKYIAILRTAGESWKFASFIVSWSAFKAFSDEGIWQALNSTLLGNLVRTLEKRSLQIVVI